MSSSSLNADDTGRAFPPGADGTVVGVGVDVVEIPRLTDRFARTPALLDRLLHPRERDLPSASRAARVAAKEAVGKALGHPGDFSWHDVTVEKTPENRPYLVLTGATRRCAEDLGITQLHLSLSHDGPIATAIVVAERTRPMPGRSAGAAGPTERPIPGSTERPTEGPADVEVPS